MQIKIEIDVRPEELRRFLGLPDVSGLQEDVVAFLRDKLGAATEFDASQFVKSNFDTLRRTPAWKRFSSKLRTGDVDLDMPAAGEEVAPAPRRRRPRKTAAKKKPDTGSE